MNFDRSGNVYYNKILSKIINTQNIKIGNKNYLFEFRSTNGDNMIASVYDDDGNMLYHNELVGCNSTEAMNRYIKYINKLLSSNVSNSDNKQHSSNCCKHHHTKDNHNINNGAIKNDDHKTMFDLIPQDALWAIANVFTKGAEKYSPNNWCAGSGFRWGRIYAALQRHLNQFWNGEDIDSEWGYYHLAHAGCCLLMLLANQLRNIGEDDRNKLNTKVEDSCAPKKCNYKKDHECKCKHDNIDKEDASDLTDLLDSSFTKDVKKVIIKKVEDDTIKKDPKIHSFMEVQAKDAMKRHGGFPIADEEFKNIMKEEVDSESNNYKIVIDIPVDLIDGNNVKHRTVITLSVIEKQINDNLYEYHIDDPFFNMDSDIHKLTSSQKLDKDNLSKRFYDIYFKKHPIKLFS